MKPTVNADWVRMMSRYNVWQNNTVALEVQALGDAEAARDRGAFFGSILGTCSHLLWGDRIWLHRLAGGPKPPGGIPESASLFSTVADWVSGRTETDAALMAWAEGLADGNLAEEVSWYSGALQTDLRAPAGLVVTHVFNHATHHRGQIHAMLTAAGRRPDDTDLFAMPGLR